MHGKVAPTLAGSEALHIQTSMAVIAPVSQADDPFQADHAAIIQLVRRQEFSVVIEVMQEPAKFPERPVMAVEAGAHGTARKRGRIENQERCRHAGVRGVAGGPEANYAGSLQPFDQRVSIRCLTEALDFGAHEGLLSETRVGIANSDGVEESVGG